MTPNEKKEQKLRLSMFKTEIHAALVKYFRSTGTRIASMKMVWNKKPKSDGTLCTVTCKARPSASISTKGGNFERDVSKLLSLWLTDGERDDCVWRTSGSGARHTTRKKRGEDTYNQAGDLNASDPCVQWFFDYFLVECKNGYTGTTNNDIQVLGWLDKARGTNPALLQLFWEKAVNECVDAGRYEPLIIFKRTGREPCIMMSTQIFTNFMGCAPYTGFAIYIQLPREESLVANKKEFNGFWGQWFVILDLEEFLMACSPKRVKAQTEGK